MPAHRAIQRPRGLVSEDKHAPRVRGSEGGATKAALFCGIPGVSRTYLRYVARFLKEARTVESKKH